MKDQKAEKEEEKKDQKTGQQLNNPGVQSGDRQTSSAGNEKQDQLRTGENENPRSGNNETIGIP